MNVEDFEVPPIGSIQSFRGIHVLSTTNKTNKRLRVTHFASCLVGGPNPVWGVWTIHGTFVRFFNRKEEIARAYPDRTWRRLNATWAMTTVDRMDAGAKRKAARTIYKVGKRASLQKHDPVSHEVEPGPALRLAVNNGG